MYLCQLFLQFCIMFKSVVTLSILELNFHIRPNLQLTNVMYFFRGFWKYYVYVCVLKYMSVEILPYLKP